MYRVINEGKYGKDYIIEAFNKKSLEIENMTEEQVVGKSLYDLRPNIDDYGLIDIFRKVWQTGESINYPSKIYIDDKYSNYYENRVFKISENNIVALYNDVTDFMVNQIELEENLNKLEKYISEAPYGVFIADENGVYIEVNEEATVITGYSKKELLGMSLTDLIPDEDKNKAISSFENVREKGRDIVEIKFVNKKGEGRYWRVRAVKLSDKRFLGFTEDITDRIREQNGIRKLREETKSLFDHAGVGIGYYDREGRVIWFNEVAAKNMGGVPSDFNGKRLDEIFPKENAREYMRRLKESIESETPVEYEDHMILPIGEVWFKSIYNKIFDSENKLLGIEIISYNITELRKAQKSLEERESRYRLLFEDAPLGYQSLDENGFFIEVNLSWLDLLGYKKNEVIGKWFGDFIIADQVEDFKTNFPKFKAKGKTFIIFKMVKKNKDVITVNFNGRIAYDQDGKFKQTHCILEDITERKKLEKERTELEVHIRNQQKLESIGTLASGVAHEINNPINGILNYGQVILDSTKPDSDINKYANEIIEETNRVSVIVSNLLEFSRQSGKQHSYANVEDIIEKTLSLTNTIFKHDNIKIDVDIEEDIPKLKCRSQQIQQVIMNLLTNARDSLNQKYPGFDDEKIINLDCTSYRKDSRNWIRIVVEDFGVGIPKEIQNRIFDPFFTTKGKDKGTGLGLSISYGIIKEHHGEMLFDSVEGEYTKFTINLPCDNGWDIDK